MHFHAPLIIDIAGTRLRKVDKKRLSHPLVGGLILFARNFTDRAQLTKLCRRIKKVRSDLLIAVDHEGGRVQRFKTDGFTHLPPMRALGQLWLQDGAAGEGSGAMRATRA
ncbi:glycoside hydrolase family 3 N-terminal domain-containing protein, partial [Rhodoferax sp.]